MIMAVINATGVEPVSSAGKPESAMYDEARLLAAHDGAEPVARKHASPSVTVSIPISKPAIVAAMIPGRADRRHQSA